MDGKNWESLADDETWSELHVFCRQKGKDSRNAYRVVAWIAGTQRVILNIKLNSSMDIKISDDWGELTENNSTLHYGMYFANSNQAHDTCLAISSALRELCAPSRRQLSTYSIVQKSANKAVLQDSWAENILVEAQRTFQDDFPYSKEEAEEEKRINLEQQHVKLSRKPSASLKSAAQTLSEQEYEETTQIVSDFSHDTHVTFNSKLSRYEGLPVGWSHVNKQFGVELQRIPRATSSRRTYTEKIPTLLLMLEDTLHELDGFDIVGIFRVAPDKDLCHAAREAIDTGESWTKDVHVVATLIKQFFRDLPPVGLFNCLSDSIITAIADGTYSESSVFSINSTNNNKEEDEKMLSSQLRAPLSSIERLTLGNSTFPEPQRTLCLWLLDLMADIVEKRDINRMTAHNMAVVMSPNLYSTQAENPMAALTMAQKVADCCQHLLDWRLRTR
uniref:Rho-GAP domain-containing protein n=1 Tax=Aureoumbra lagunensis TaxID=44058 RepID=A0A7S3K0I9_9STRA